MLESMQAYAPAVWSLIGIAVLMLVQLLIADVAGILAGHKPGFPIEARGASFLFRASRTFANSNESIAIFVMLLLANLFLQSDPAWINGLALSYLVCRLVYTFAYYAHLAVFRSVVFALSIVVLIAMACVPL